MLMIVVFAMPIVCKLVLREEGSLSSKTRITLARLRGFMTMSGRSGNQVIED